MKYLDLTLSTAAQNLALDEALLDGCDASPEWEALRFWEPKDYFVVVGYANRVTETVNREACQEQAIPIRRRCSGGGTVLQGPGCLNYSLVLRISETGPLAGITEANAWIMQAHQSAMHKLLGRPVTIQGTTDLTLGSLKFSGNAQRRKRDALLFHGTFLLNFDLARVEKFLTLPLQQPPYRSHRSHQDFLTNLNIPVGRVKEALKQHWQAHEIYEPVPFAECKRLADDKYSRQEWHYKW